MFGDVATTLLFIVIWKIFDNFFILPELQERECTYIECRGDILKSLWLVGEMIFLEQVVDHLLFFSSLISFVRNGQYE